MQRAECIVEQLLAVLGEGGKRLVTGIVSGIRDSRDKTPPHGGTALGKPLR
jgi:hypothetical protein